MYLGTLLLLLLLLLQADRLQAGDTTI